MAHCSREHVVAFRRRRLAHNRTRHRHEGRLAMSKGMDRKKEQKKEPAKSLKEKRAAKKEKKAGK
jgi:hypothetical protein